MTCAVYFTKDEWDALTAFVNKTKCPPAEPPSWSIIALDLSVSG